VVLVARGSKPAGAGEEVGAHGAEGSHDDGGVGEQLACFGLFATGTGNRELMKSKKKVNLEVFTALFRGKRFRIRNPIWFSNPVQVLQT
jgi:hypothetical protein